ncbi:hypothetical protein BX611_0538 [Lutibacter oceani]|uniref:Uncharacterized protein n=1 Tax=Lutibacter oceani TaxID=1853311 RepID=A0A3D9RZF6_9FLAO|nr:hypothetical protein [Lutibacter oceani]REE83251.1 hypothetical protein BX611_0538 [Lutibacter oceani]
MNYIKLISVTFILFCTIGFSQNSDVEHIYTNATSLTSVDLTSKKLVGSSYIDVDFRPAKVSNSEAIYLIRYNAYLDEMEIEISGKAYYLPKSNNYTVTFEGVNKVYQLSNYDEKGTQKKGFFMVLTSGDNISLLKQEKIKLYEEVPAKLGFTRYEPPKLSRVKDKYFIGYKNKTTVELPKKKKDFLNLFSSKSKDIGGFMKKNKLNIKNTEHLTQIFNYYKTIN